MTFTYTIQDGNGLDARPAGSLVKMAKTLSSNVGLICNGKMAAATKLSSLLFLNAKCGNEVTIQVENSNEETEKADAAFMENWLKGNL
jgi:phosphocarrier protein